MFLKAGTAVKGHASDNFHKGFAAVGPEIIATIPHYTDAQPMIQIGEVRECWRETYH